MNFQQFKELAKVKYDEFLVALAKEKVDQKAVFELAKSELKTNLVDGIKNGTIKKEVSKNFSDFFKLENFKLGFKSQEIPNKIAITKIKDRSVNVFGGNKYGFKKTFANRWEIKTVQTHLCTVKGLIVAKAEPVSVNGVQFPPRFKRDLNNVHYLKTVQA